MCDKLKRDIETACQQLPAIRACTRCAARVTLGRTVSGSLTPEKFHSTAFFSFLQKTLPPTSCGPTYKLCMPSELVTRFMTKFIDVDFDLREATTQSRWQVQIGPRRNKAKFEFLLLVRTPPGRNRFFMSGQKGLARKGQYSPSYDGRKGTMGICRD